jgi:hypothetical protein
MPQSGHNGAQIKAHSQNTDLLSPVAAGGAFSPTAPPNARCGNWTPFIQTQIIRIIQYCALIMTPLEVILFIRYSLSVLSGDRSIFKGAQGT